MINHLYRHYEEGCINDSVVNFCWREPGTGTVLQISIPFFYHVFSFYIRLRPSIPWKWHQRFYFVFRYSNIYREINSRLFMSDRLPIDWNLLSSGDARTHEQRDDDPLPLETIAKRIQKS